MLSEIGGLLLAGGMVRGAAMGSQQFLTCRMAAQTFGGGSSSHRAAVGFQCYPRSVGFCWLVAWSAVRLWDRSSSSPVAWPRRLLVAAAVVIALLSVSNVIRDRWASAGWWHGPRCGYGIAAVPHLSHGRADFWWRQQ